MESTIAKCIQRFRSAPPLPADARRLAGVSEADFWWLHNPDSPRRISPLKAQHTPSKSPPHKHDLPSAPATPAHVSAPIVLPPTPDSTVSPAVSGASIATPTQQQHEPQTQQNELGRASCLPPNNTAEEEPAEEYEEEDAEEEESPAGGDGEIDVLDRRAAAALQER